MFELTRLRLSPARGRLYISALGFNADDYLRFLLDQGYARSTIKIYSKCVAHFACWLNAQGLRVADLDERLIERFLKRHLPTYRCADQYRRPRREVHAALMQLLKLLRIKGRIDPKASTTPAAIDKELQDFTRHLIQVCGLSPETCRTRVGRVRAFLLEQFGTHAVRLSTLDRDDIARFMRRNSARWKPVSQQAMGCALRSYLRFKALAGEHTAALSAAIPRIAQWRLASIPKSLSATEISQFLGSFDRHSPTGQRDYAIARCCADLGLRAAEVARLCLEDLDWPQGTLLIRGKGRRIDVLPLPRITGRAIVAYLRAGRPATTSQSLFLCHHPPRHRPVTSSAIRQAFRKAARHCGLKHRISGSHVLRHTIAQRLLQRGATLKQIADLLRHRCLDTTTIYTKVDLQALSHVAQPWPGSRP